MNRHTLRSHTSAELEQIVAELRASKQECNRLRVSLTQIQDEFNQSKQSNTIERTHLQRLASVSGELLEKTQVEASAATRKHTGEVESFRLLIDQRVKEFALYRLQSERLLKNIPVGIAFLDKGLVCRWVNYAFTRVANLPLEQIVNRPFFEAFPAAQVEIGALLQAVIQQGVSDIPVKLPFVQSSSGPDGSTQWDFLALPTQGVDNVLDGILIAVEVTEKVKLSHLGHERQLQLDRFKGDFINMVSHELRTPLTTIAGYAEFLEDNLGGTLTPDQHGYVTKIQEAESRIRRIVDDLLDFARLDAGTFRLHLEATDLLALIREQIMALVPTCYAANVTTQLITPTVDCLVRADSKRVSQVLLNLLGNAIKFTPAGGQVSISISKRETDVCVFVRDTGPSVR
jgi:signal transduction histidine kinase